MRRWIKSSLVVLLATLLLSLPAGYDTNHFAIWMFSTAFIHSLAWSLAILWVVHRRPILMQGFFAVIFLFFFLETTCYLLFGTRINETVMTIVMQTDLQEASSFANSYLISWTALVILVVGCLLFYLMLRWVKVQRLEPLYQPWVSRILVVVTMVFGFVLPSISLPWTNHGYNTVEGLYHAIDFVEESHSDLDQIVTMLGRIQVYQQPEQADAPVIVLVIGESYNKYHAALYGYPLQTTPRLSAEKNLAVFEHAYTPVCYTHSAMRYIFSLKSCDRRQAGDSLQYVLFPAVFKKAGYRVGYFDNQFTQMKVGFRDYSSGYFMSPPSVSHQCFDVRNTFIDPYDGPFVEQCQGSFLKAGKSLNIIHLYGQHLEANKRYPKEYAYFTGADIQRENLDEGERQLVAEYDNATRYNDMVLGMILDAFRQQDVVLVYLSDHGDNIYDGPQRRYGRPAGGLYDEESKRNIREIPFIIWWSDVFAAKRPEVVETIRQRSRRMVCLDDVAYLLFDLGGISSNFSCPSRSVIHTNYRPHRIAME